MSQTKRKLEYSGAEIKRPTRLNFIQYYLGKQVDRYFFYVSRRSKTKDHRSTVFNFRVAHEDMSTHTLSVIARSAGLYLTARCPLSKVENACASKSKCAKRHFQKHVNRTIYPARRAWLVTWRTRISEYGIQNPA